MVEQNAMVEGDHREGDSQQPEFSAAKGRADSCLAACFGRSVVTGFLAVAEQSASDDQQRRPQERDKSREDNHGPTPTECFGKDCAERERDG